MQRKTQSDGPPETVEIMGAPKPAARELVKDYAIPVGVAVAAGILSGAAAIQVVGLSVVAGVVTGIVTAAVTLQKLLEARSKSRS